MKTTYAAPTPRPPTLVDAAPFRAHIRHTSAVAGVPWPAVAVAAGVPPATLANLLSGRADRVPKRIHRQVAVRLIRVRAEQLIRLRAGHVDATETRQRLGELLCSGVSPQVLANWCAITPGELARLVDGEAASCSKLTAALASAAHRLRDLAAGRADRAA